jgi:hypothetical protein
MLLLTTWTESEEEQQKAMAMFLRLKAYAPDFNGPVPSADAVKSVLTVVEKASIDGGYAGAFVSHTGDKQWL